MVNKEVSGQWEVHIFYSETKQQPRADGKMITRNYFYIDYKQFVDIVKYRIYKMRQSVEDMIKKVRGNFVIKFSVSRLGNGKQRIYLH